MWGDKHVPIYLSHRVSMEDMLQLATYWPC